MDTDVSRLPKFTKCPSRRDQCLFSVLRSGGHRAATVESKNLSPEHFPSAYANSIRSALAEQKLSQLNHIVSRRALPISIHLMPRVWNRCR